MARRFLKVSEEEIKTAFFYPPDLVNTKTTTSPSGDGCILFTFMSVLVVDISPAALRLGQISTTIHLHLSE